MALLQISSTNMRVPRRKKYVEEMLARFVAGTFSRIQAVLAPGEDRADLVREAVERELRRRSRPPTKSSINQASDSSDGVDECSRP